MGKITLVVAAIFLGAATGFAQSWTGDLVDSKCYTSEENNVNPFDPPSNVNHDRGYEIRVCRPNARTKSFTVVDSDGRSFQLDASGNSKAAEVLRQADKKSRLLVTVTGEKHKDTLTVDSITLVKGK